MKPSASRLSVRSTKQSITRKRKDTTAHFAANDSASILGHRAALWGILLGLLVALVVFAPAAWLTPSLGQATNDQWRLVAAQGTVWQGSAELQVGSPASALPALGAGTGLGASLNANPNPNSNPLTLSTSGSPIRLYWRMAPAWQEGALRMALHVTAPCCLAQELPIVARRQLGGWSVQTGALQLEWPAHILAALGAPWNTLSPQGLLRLQSSGMQWSSSEKGARLQGSARLSIEQLTTALSTVKPLGNYVVTATADSAGQSIDLQLQTVQGALLLSGSGKWTLPQAVATDSAAANASRSGVHFRGEASAAAGSQEALANLLNIIGQRDGARSLISIG